MEWKLVGTEGHDHTIHPFTTQHHSHDMFHLHSPLVASARGKHPSSRPRFSFTTFSSLRDISVEKNTSLTLCLFWSGNPQGVRDQSLNQI